MLTDLFAKALTIIYHAGEMSTADFSHRMWVDSLGAKRMAGAFLGKLRKRKLLTMNDCGNWCLTTKGITELGRWHPR